ncbi:quinol oxidase subunit 4 [Chitinophaga sp. CB10]|uniref:quinol oxidase subunit 4 n=1 Tax=Chitinophaga sp. CB10 TaxID=1891659 RepID=UPI0025C59B70|nr:quinol oxidase subunit 4 [Chitinophaga sp. CB10]
MKKYHILVATVAILLFTSCYTTVHTAGNSGKIPPGQAKKMTGSKSARPYAPGQQKH